ncbi:MAG TPA: response regulator transcription factor [Flavisolibacter sp.]|jgi:DNA-binding NarL/FixJ family response regulator
MNTRILLVDDHAMVMDGLAHILNGEPLLDVVAQVTSGAAALQLLKHTPVDIVIADHSMPGMTGRELAVAIKKDHPTIGIIMLSMHDEPAIVREAIQSGIDGYILKKYSHQELLKAVEIVQKGGQFWSREISHILVKGITGEDQHTLTDREKEVLQLLAQEMNSREIATTLFISERTVETHRKNMLRKAGATTTVGLIKYAYTHKLLQ